MATPPGSRSGPNASTSDALVVAACELLADRPPSAITGRQLATAAGVPYGLVHRHFGSKRRVFAAALNLMLADYVDTDYGDDDLPIPLRLGARRPLVRALAHQVLDREGFGGRGQRSAAIDRALGGLGRSRPELDDRQRRALVALAAAIEIGLPLHREVLVDGVGVRGNDPAIDHLVGRWLDGLYHGRGPLGGAPVPEPGGRRPSHVELPDGTEAGRSTEDRLVLAGARLVTERAPSSITGRELAAAAGVNYGLVHHYFGGKDEALRASLQHLRDRYWEATSSPRYSPRFFAVCDHPGYVHAMTWGALDSSLQVSGMRYPVTAQLVDRLSTRASSREAELATRVAVMTAVAAQLAWALFQPVLAATLDDDLRDLEPLAASLLRRLLVDPVHDITVPG